MQLYIDYQKQQAVKNNEKFRSLPANEWNDALMFK